MPAWLDMFGKVIPLRYRGRQLATSSALGAAMGLAGAFASGYFLSAYAFPTSYGLCFLAGFVAMMLSWVFLASAREPAAAFRTEHRPLGAYLRRLPDILRGNPDFAWYLVSKCIGTLASMGYGFFTVFALRSLGAPEWQVARFTFVLLAGQTIASLALGYFGDRFGHKRVLVAGMSAASLASLAALLSQRPEHIYASFLLFSVSIASGTVSDLNLPVEFAAEGERPTYVALAAAPVAPVAVLAPLLGGLLADTVSYRAVFAVAALAGFIGAVTLATRVRDPRHHKAT
jgi:MFS family permease